MPNYLFAYTGGGTPASEEEGRKVMEAWMGWLGGLGDAVVDGGNPFAGSKTVASDGKTGDGAPSGLSGYSVIRADSLDQASALAKGCPQLDAGGTVEIYETVEVM